MVSITELIKALRNFLAEEEEKEPAEWRAAHTPKPRDDIPRERCMVCGLEISYAEMMYENGYAVCFMCYKTRAIANYYGRVIWLES
ncbi:MAG: hypothetical protein QXG98_05950 [Candidatus Micrarchaeia archaeon]